LTEYLKYTILIVNQNSESLYLELLINIYKGEKEMKLKKLISLKLGDRFVIPKFSTSGNKYILTEKFSETRIIVRKIATGELMELNGNITVMIE